MLSNSRLLVRVWQGYALAVSERDAVIQMAEEEVIGMIECPICGQVRQEPILACYCGFCEKLKADEADDRTQFGSFLDGRNVIQPAEVYQQSQPFSRVTLR